ncbi:MAG: hypothetical protein ACUVR8_13650 [Acidobacteriota bacterium]
MNTLVNPRTNKYILDELRIVQLTSTRDLIGKEKTLAAQPISKKTAALFGDPKYDLDTQEYIQIASVYNLTREYYNIKNTLSEAERETIMPLPGTRVEIDKDKRRIREEEMGSKEILRHRSIRRSYQNSEVSNSIAYSHTRQVFARCRNQSRGASAGRYREAENK